MVLVVTVGSLAPVATASGGTVQRDISFTRYDAASMGLGKHRGTVVTDAGIAFGTATGKREQAGRSYERARWTAPWQMSDFAYTELIASWAAATPGDSWLEVEVRGRNSKGGRRPGTCWAGGRPATSSCAAPPSHSQSDDLAAVDVDTWKVRGSGGLVSWQVRLALPQARLHRPDRGRPRRDDEPSPARLLRGRLHPRPAGRHRARRAGALADGALGPLPAVVAAARRGARRRRPRWCSATSTLPPPYTYRFVPAGHLALGRLRRPQDLRRGVRRHRQLAVQHRVRRPARRRRLRHPAPVAARGGAALSRGIPLVASVSWDGGRAGAEPRCRPPTATWW